MKQQSSGRQADRKNARFPAANIAQFGPEKTWREPSSNSHQKVPMGKMPN
jgi:hypothetical protein